MNENNELDADQKFWLAIWRTIAVVLCCLIITMGGCQAFTNKLFVDGNYVQTTIPGHSDAVWTKATK